MTWNWLNLLKRRLGLVSTPRPGCKTRRLASSRPRRLFLELLEDRLTPTASATFAEAGAVLNLGLAANNQLAIVSNGTSYTLSLGATGTWSGINSANETGNGTSNLTVTAAGISAFTTGINLTDFASTGGDGVTFNNSGANAYANNLAITLAHSTTGLVFISATSLAGSSTLTAASSGGILVNTGAGLTLNGGALSLSATGTNAPLIVNGGVTGSGGSMILQAMGNLLVGANALVGSGSGPLTLAADVTAAGVGDDGLGTLTMERQRLRRHPDSPRRRREHCLHRERGQRECRRCRHHTQRHARRTKCTLCPGLRWQRQSLRRQ